MGTAELIAEAESVAATSERLATCADCLVTRSEAFCHLGLTRCPWLGIDTQRDRRVEVRHEGMVPAWLESCSLEP